MFASFANTGAHETSILSYDGIRTLQCHYFPSVGPAGVSLCSPQWFFLDNAFKSLSCTLNADVRVARATLQSIFDSYSDISSLLEI